MQRSPFFSSSLCHRIHYHTGSSVLATTYYCLMYGEHHPAFNNVGFLAKDNVKGKVAWQQNNLATKIKHRLAIIFIFILKVKFIHHVAKTLASIN